MTFLPSKALVLFSGGQDSTTCLAWSLQNFDHVETLSFHYNQRHAIELEQCAIIHQQFNQHFPHWTPRLGAHHQLDATVLSALGQTAMTENITIELAASGLPNTFVPGRNLLFFTLAGALAYRRDIHDLIGGMCETDYSGYPDCRDTTIKAQQHTLSLGLDKTMTIHTPLMWLNKAQTFALAHQLGGNRLLDIILEHTHTCYKGEHTLRHEWGYGCNDCPACHLRAKGWKEYKTRQ